EARAICERIAQESGFKGVEVDEGLAKVSAVGVGMRTHTGVAATMFKALADAKINISHISTSEIVLSCIVRREDGHKALQVVHDAFGLDRA
ncbi:MAG TPA: ACT domain-containing protein, partial [Phycisphaerae bacterium]